MRDQLVAVKMFRLDAPPEQAAAIAESLQTLVSSLPRHSSLLPLLAAGVERDMPYLVMTHSDVPSLDTRLKPGVPLEPDQAMSIVRLLAEAIDAAHARDIVHGSLHPRDIFVDEHGEVKVSGFGIGTALVRAGLRAPVRRPYSAPERLMANTIEPAADRFALGALAFELLCGRRLVGTGRDAAARCVLPAPAAGSAPAGDPEYLRTALAAMLAENPAHRPSRASAFAQSLAISLFPRGGASRTRVRTTRKEEGAAGGGATEGAPSEGTRTGRQRAARATRDDAPSADELELFARQGTLWEPESRVAPQPAPPALPEDDEGDPLALFGASPEQTAQREVIAAARAARAGEPAAGRADESREAWDAGSKAQEQKAPERESGEPRDGAPNDLAPNEVAPHEVDVRSGGAVIVPPAYDDEPPIAPGSVAASTLTSMPAYVPPPVSRRPMPVPPAASMPSPIVPALSGPASIGPTSPIDLGDPTPTAFKARPFLTLDQDEVDVAPIERTQGPRFIDDAHADEHAERSAGAEATKPDAGAEALDAAALEAAALEAASLEADAVESETESDDEFESESVVAESVADESIADKSIAGESVEGDGVGRIAAAAGAIAVHTATADAATADADAAAAGRADADVADVAASDAGGADAAIAPEATAAATDIVASDTVAKDTAAKDIVATEIAATDMAAPAATIAEDATSKDEDDAPRAADDATVVLPADRVTPVSTIIGADAAAAPGPAAVAGAAVAGSVAAATPAAAPTLASASPASAWTGLEESATQAAARGTADTAEVPVRAARSSASEPIAESASSHAAAAISSFTESAVADSGSKDSDWKDAAFTESARERTGPIVSEPEPADTGNPFRLVALVLAIGLAVGGAAGYLVGKRGALQNAENSVTVPETAPIAGAGPGAQADAPPARATGADTAGRATPVSGAARGNSNASRTPAAAAPARPAATTGRLVIRSTPARAEVAIDGARRGATPLTIRNLPFGSHVVRVTRSGYAPEARRVTLGANRASETLTFELERVAPPRPSAPARPAASPADGAAPATAGTNAPVAAAGFGALQVLSRPAGARVLVDGRPVGVTPLVIQDVAPGARTVRLELDGHKPWTSSVRVTAGQRVRVAASLEEGSQD